MTDKTLQRKSKMCPRCDFANLVDRKKNRVFYHLIYHTPFGHVYWFPHWFYSLMSWYRIWLHRDYFGKFSWHGWSGFYKDLKFANDMTKMEFE